MWSSSFLASFTCNLFCSSSVEIATFTGRAKAKIHYPRRTLWDLQVLIHDSMFLLQLLKFWKAKHGTRRLVSAGVMHFIKWHLLSLFWTFWSIKDMFRILVFMSSLFFHLHFLSIHYLWCDYVTVFDFSLSDSKFLYLAMNFMIITFGKKMGKLWRYSTLCMALPWCQKNVNWE